MSCSGCRERQDALAEWGRVAGELRTERDELRRRLETAGDLIEQMAMALYSLGPGTLHHYQREWLKRVISDWRGPETIARRARVAGGDGESPAPPSPGRGDEL